ncbi:ClbS/DfsB family four-helix bundle protein [uncultured Bartonella sp.]|uniref:ClbS/DfsB family four-helix bundle protein n=1 Tax=uncultured Bartonella sp. TaxID=104108 RepID=UPI0025CCB425|nr:ClbS/DfsB family four-helix bundle protein [uncultured Bartonella sp.]
MSIPQNKNELLNAIETNFSKLAEDLRKMPADVSVLPFMEGHSKGELMNVSNLVAYLIGWNELVLKWLDQDQKGEPIDFPDTGYKWNELGKLAQKFYADHHNIPFDTLVIQLTNVKDRIVDEINKKTDEELYGREWCGKYTMGRMISLNTSSPYSNARDRLRKWLTAFEKK